MEDISHLKLANLEGLESGVGVNCSLHEVKVCQRTCSAKRLSDVLQEVGGDGALGEEEVAVVAQRFRRECVSLSKLRHPNVLQFMGVHCGAGPFDITLVVEHVYTSLDQCLQTHPNVDLSLKLSVLFDVSCGLLYLHTRDPPVVHRNLTASNVVLTRDMMGKIADLRVSKVFDLETQVSRLPEGLMYMPPEVLANPPSCDVKMDVFSFGVLCLYVANEGFATSSCDEPPSLENSPSLQNSPRPTPPHTAAHADLRAKRDCTLEKIGRQHTLYSTISLCVQEASGVRPSMEDVSDSLQKLCSQNQRNFKDILKSIVDFEGRKDLKCLRACLAEKKDEISKLSQRLVNVDIAMSKLEATRTAVVKNRDKRKTSTLTTTKEHSMRGSFDGTTKNGHFPVLQIVQEKLRLSEEEKKQLQIETQKTCLGLLHKAESLQAEIDTCRQELIQKSQECDILRARLQHEKGKDPMGVVEESIVTSQEVAKVGSGRLVKTPSRDRKQDVTCDACGELKTKIGELRASLEQYQDECLAYEEQSNEQKRQIRFHADAHEVLKQENAKLKRSLEQEQLKVEELLAEVKGRVKEASEVSSMYQHEVTKRLSLETKCADMELVNDTLRQENLVLFNQNQELKLHTSKSHPETFNLPEVRDGLGTSSKEEVPPLGHLGATPEDHWERTETLTPSEQMAATQSAPRPRGSGSEISCCHGDEDQTGATLGR